MTSFKRYFCLLLILALLLPGATYRAHADEATTTATTLQADATPATTDTAPTTDTSTQPTDTASTSSASDTNTSTTTSSTVNVVDDHITTTTSASTTTETDTTLNASLSQGGTATTTLTTATTTPEVAPTNTSSPAGPSLTDDASTTVALDTLATTTASSEGTSTPAPITPEVPAGSSTPVAITTGDATVGANVVNALNSSFVNSSGEIVLSNYFDPLQNGLDLRSASSTFTTGSICQLFICTGSQGVTLNLSGTSTLENLLVLNATSGGNMIITPGGNASITTGNAFTGLNLVNLANLNVVNSNYFIAALNIFRSVTGDIIFPGLSGFFDTLTSGTVPSTLDLESLAHVDTQIDFLNQTGANTTDATSSAIVTGSTRTVGNVMNQLNANDIGGANLAVILRVAGSWKGDIFSAPDGLTVVHGDDGSIYLMSKGAASGLGLDDSSMSASSSAAIVNHATLGAFTGDNGIFGADSARIVTGNAFTGANILNVANQNIVGKNWLTAVVNIFGDFTGNIAFGRPDLWVGERVEAPAPLQNGSDLVFHFTITNKGDAPATAATFTATMDSSHLSFIDAPTFTTTLGTLAPGQSTEVVYDAKVNAPPGTDIVTGGSASAHEADNNPADNSDSVSLKVLPVRGGESFISRSLSYPKPQPFSVSRRTDNVVIGGTTRTVHESLAVFNPNDATSSPVDLHDLLKDPSGTVLEDEAWPLGTLAPHEEVNIAYDAAFATDTPPGRYTLSSVLVSDVLGDTEFKDNGTITLIGIPEGASAPHKPTIGAATLSRQVLGEASTSPGSPLLAAAANAQIPWTYALSFVAAAAALGGFLYAILWLRRRYL